MRIFRYFLPFALAFSLISPAFAAVEKTALCDTNPPHYFSIFTRQDCVNCIRLHKFLDTNFASGSHRLPKYYDLADEKNSALFETFTTKFRLTKTTPIILVGDTIIQGFA